jgi:Pyridoxamine 5'-phosphate oxidase
MSAPTTEMIRRVSDATKQDGYDEASLAPADWDDVRSRLRDGPGPCWLSTTMDGASHVRPVFAAWTGESFVVASNPRARKTRALQEESRCSVAIDLKDLHVVVEGVARRLTTEPDLGRATVAFQEVYGWPTEVAGDLLEAPYAAPTSGGPPFEVYEIRPVRAYGFPTADQVEPTRWQWNDPA